MDNQINTQEPVNQLPNNQEPVVEQPPIPQQETPVVQPENTTQEPVVNTTLTEVPQEPVLSQPEQPSVPSSEYQKVLDQYAAAQPPQPQVEPPIVENSIRSSEEQLKDLGISVPQKAGGSIFKIIFIISLIIFILVSSALAFVYFQSQKTQKANNSNDSSFDTVQTANPTETQKGTCMLNDKTYKIGESFIAADGCNSCTCSTQDMITCTEKSCLAPTNSTIKPSTQSAVKN